MRVRVLSVSSGILMDYIEEVSAYNLTKRAAAWRQTACSMPDSSWKPSSNGRSALRKYESRNVTMLASERTAAHSAGKSSRRIASKSLLMVIRDSAASALPSGR